MREKSGRARKREDESPSVGDGRKSAAEERRGGATRGEGEGGGRRKATRWKRWWISRRVEDGWVARRRRAARVAVPLRGGERVVRRVGRGAGARAYGAGKLTPFLAYPRSLFNCILLSNFPRRAIDRDTRKGVRLRLISDGPRRLLSALYPRLSPPSLLRHLLRFFSSFLSQSAPFARPPFSLSFPRPLFAVSTPFVLDYLIHLTHINPIRRESENVRAPRTPAGRPPLSGLFKTTHSQCVRRRTGSAQGRRARREFLF